MTSYTVHLNGKDTKEWVAQCWTFEDAERFAVDIAQRRGHKTAVRSSDGDLVIYAPDGFVSSGFVNGRIVA